METRAKRALSNGCIDESCDSDENPIAINPKKKFEQSTTTFNDMPDDILYEIFKYFSPIQMNDVIMNVSHRWRIIALHPLFWRKFATPGKGSYYDTQKSICNVLRVAGNHLLELSLTNRYDTDVILAQVARCNKNLRSLSMSRCKGSYNDHNIRADAIKNVLIKLPKIQTFYLYESHFRSIKFFELLGRRTSVEYADNSRKSKVNSFTYTGIIKCKQLLAYAKNADMTGKIAFNDGEEYSIENFIREILEGKSGLPRAIVESLEIHLKVKLN